MSLQPTVRLPIRILLIVLGICAVGLLLAAVILPRVVENRVADALRKSLPGLQVEAIEANFLGRYLHLNRLSGEITPPVTVRYAMQVRDANVELSRISWLRLVTSNRLDCRHLHVDGAMMQLSHASDSISVDSTRSDQTSDPVSLQFDQIAITQDSFSIELVQDQPKLSIRRVAAIADDVGYVPGQPFDWTALARASRFELEGISILTSDRLHSLSIDTITASGASRQTIVTGLAFTPTVSRMEFRQRAGYKKDYIELTVPKIEMTGMDIDSLAAREIVINQLSIPSFALDVFTDKNLPHRSEVYKKLPQRVYAELPAKITIDTISINQGHVRYSLQPDYTENVGYVEFHNLAAELTNVTNNPARWQEDNVVNAHIQTQLCGAAPLDVRFRIPMQEHPWTYYASGRLVNFALQKTNTLTEEAARMKFESGTVDELTFQITSTPEVAEGELTFLYQDLDLEFLSGKDRSKINILDDIAEWIMFPQDNLQDGKYKVGSVYYERDQSRSIFHFLWQAVLSGIRSTILPNIALPKELKHDKVKE